jgi:5'-methylthioadenosine phosphorylase
MSIKPIKIGIIGGSGLDDPKLLANFEEKEIETPFGAPAAKLVLGRLAGREVVILARHGKDHSIMPTKVPYRANLWALKEIGCTHILATTACGSLRDEIKPGDLVFVDQFIDNTKHRVLTFFEDKVIHTPMAEPFCASLRKLLVDSAKDLKLSYHDKGTMITIEGPRFSTRAESHLFRFWQADTVNMSTEPEVILARELGICYQSIAMSTDYDCWKEGEEPVTWEMIVARMAQNADNVKKLLTEVVPKIKFYDCSCRSN